MSHYSKGRQYEYRTIKSLKDQGFNCIRSAGSHGPFDIVAWNEDVIYFIQVKVGVKPTRKEIDEILNIPVPMNAVKLLFNYIPRQELKIEEVK